MYFPLDGRQITIILDVPYAATFFEALHATWAVTKQYTNMSPVADVSELPDLLSRTEVVG